MIATRRWTFGVFAFGMGSAWLSSCTTSTTNIYQMQNDGAAGATGGSFPSGGAAGDVGDAAAEAVASGGAAGTPATGGAAGADAAESSDGAGAVGGSGTIDAGCTCSNPLPGECWYHSCPSCTAVPLPKDSYCNSGSDQCDGAGNCVDCTNNGGCGECCVCTNQACVNA
jgi:hypothetical protein